MQGELFSRPLVFVDIETTGGSPQACRVLELAALRVEAGRVVDSLDVILDPGADVPWFITNLTGIKTEDTWGAPSFSQVAKRFLSLFSEGAVFIAHNVSFDYGFLQAEYNLLGERLHVPKACTVQLSRTFYPEQRHHRLDAVIERHGIVVEDRHRALGDAQALVDFYGILCGKFGENAVATAIMQQALRRPTSKRSLR